MSVDIDRANRQFERFLQDGDPGFNLETDGKGDEHLTPEELIARQENDRRLEAGLKPLQIEIVATIIFEEDGSIVVEDHRESC